MSTFTIDYVRYAWQMLAGDRSRGEQDMATRRGGDIAPYLDMNCPLRVLDLANGRLRPQYTLLKAAGHRVYGIDFINRPHLSKTDIAYGLARWLYRWKLGVKAETRTGRTLTCGNVGTLPFPDNSFDLVTSVAAFEHFLDVPSVVAELQRVVRPGGIVWACIHLFTSLTGGHNLSFTEFPLRSVPSGVDPWDHLRKRCLPFHVPLNEWRQEQYVDTFSDHFDVLTRYCLMREGEDMLTPKIEAELSDFSRDELTCGAFVIMARKGV